MEFHWATSNDRGKDFTWHLSPYTRHIADLYSTMVVLKDGRCLDSLCPSY